MEHRKAELRETGPCDAPGDDPARFLRELRQLRAEAGLGHAELAARAHYPYDVIHAAEAGPSLPSLPVLSAYVQGCGGTAAEWEERWRSLTKSPASPLLPVRSAGGSEAATAGARAGTVAPDADGHDPSLIMAALGRVADGMAAVADGRAADSPSATAAIGGPGAAGTDLSVPSAATPDGALRRDAAAGSALAGSAGTDAVSSAGVGAWAAPIDGAPPGTGSGWFPPSRAVIAGLIVIVCLVATVVALLS